MSFWPEIWEEWFRDLAKDCLKSFSILAVLYGFWEALSLMRFRGYPEEDIQALDKAHFAFLYAAFLVLGITFVLRLVTSQWPKKKK
jgi:hypothetical protein